MTYNWQDKNWPNFVYDESVIASTVLEFAVELGELRGMIQTLPEPIKQDTVLEIMLSEAIKTSAIEGEFYSREDVMSSIKNKIGIHPSVIHIKDKEARGIGELMVAVHSNFSTELSETMLQDWHRILFNKSYAIQAGSYRSGKEPMVIVSGFYGREVIHYEAPASNQVPREMQGFVQWYNKFEATSLQVNKVIIKTALAHLYFETIHPFEDGNGRIGRALAEKCISESFGYPVVLSLSSAIDLDKKAYYDHLKQAQRTLQVTEWLLYFTNLLVTAQRMSKDLIHFTLIKTRFLDTHLSLLNERQLKVVLKMLDAGIDGFVGGMTAKKYLSITKISKATATRDLQDLVDKKILNITGAGRSVSYQLCLQF